MCGVRSNLDKGDPATWRCPLCAGADARSRFVARTNGARARPGSPIIFSPSFVACRAEAAYATGLAQDPNNTHACKRLRECTDARLGEAYAELLPEVRGEGCFFGLALV